MSLTWTSRPAVPGISVAFGLHAEGCAVSQSSSRHISPLLVVQDGSGDGVVDSTQDGGGNAPVPGKKPAMEQLVRSGTRAPTGTMAADEERADLAKSSSTAVQRHHRRWPGQRVVGPIIGWVCWLVVSTPITL